MYVFHQAVKCCFTNEIFYFYYYCISLFVGLKGVDCVACFSFSYAKFQEEMCSMLMQKLFKLTSSKNGRIKVVISFD